MKASAKAASASSTDSEEALQKFIDKFQPENPGVDSRDAQGAPQTDFPPRTNWSTPTTISSSSATVRANARPIASSRLPREQTEWAFRSTMARRFLIRIRFCWAQAVKIVSSEWSPQRRWRVLRWKDSSRQQLRRGRRPYRKAETENLSFALDFGEAEAIPDANR